MVVHHGPTARPPVADAWSPAPRPTRLRGSRALSWRPAYDRCLKSALLLRTVFGSGAGSLFTCRGRYLAPTAGHARPWSLFQGYLHCYVALRRPSWPRRLRRTGLPVRAASVLSPAGPLTCGGWALAPAPGPGAPPARAFPPRRALGRGHRAPATGTWCPRHCAAACGSLLPLPLPTVSGVGSLRHTCCAWPRSTRPADPGVPRVPASHALPGMTDATAQHDGPSTPNHRTGWVMRLRTQPRALGVPARDRAGRGSTPPTRCGADTLQSRPRLAPWTAGHGSMVVRPTDIAHRPPGLPRGWARRPASLPLRARHVLSGRALRSSRP